MAKKVNITDLTWWLSLVSSSNMGDNQFSVLKNMFYNKDKRIQSRRWYTTFWNSIWTDPITSYFFFQNDTTWVRTAICTAGTQMYKYNESTSNWGSIKTGLTAFESDGTTRTKWSFAVYKNIVYMCNGVDAYASYDGTTYTEYGSQPKVRYLRYMWDSIYWWWEDTNPNTMYATSAGASNGNTLNANSLVVWGDELGRINWMLDLWDLFLVFKDKKIYSVSWDLTQSRPIDTQNGWFSHRAIKNVENAILYYSDVWVDRLKPREWLAGASALASEPLSNDLRELIDKIKPKHYNANIGYYIAPLNSYYFSFDTSDDWIPDTTLVYNTLVGAWTQYNLPAIYDYWYYIDSTGNYKYLVSSANTGQMYEIETWFEDNWEAITSELTSKKYDFDDPSSWKTMNDIDLIGYKNEWSEINIEVKVDDEVAMTSVITDAFMNTNISEIVSGSIWSQPIWLYWLWSSSSTDDVELYPYLIRLPVSTSWPNIEIRMYSDSQPNVWTLDKATIHYDELSVDIFALGNIW